MDKSSSPDAPLATQSRFWVGPLVAGCCFALGYGITGRVLTLKINVADPVPEAFRPRAFPGDSLQELRARFSEDESVLQVDVAALEAAEAARRPVKAEVKTTRQPDLALQTPQPPTWTAPVWSDPQTMAPDLDADLQPEVPEADGAAPPSAQAPEVDRGDSNADPLVLPEESLEVMPAVVIPDGDSPVLVAEPEPTVMPPGAEAFAESYFETVDPVIPPQP